MKQGKEWVEKYRAFQPVQKVEKIDHTLLKSFWVEISRRLIRINQSMWKAAASSWLRASTLFLGLKLAILQVSL